MKKERIPIRRCILSNEMHPKRDMTRVVVDKEGEISTDVTGKKQGRDAYVSKDIVMVEKVWQRETLEKYLKASKEQLDPVHEEIIGLIYKEGIPKRV